jgi:2-oxoisovalerate dehydrogenase E2 component (dihydrolipoyl transacylase)
VPIVPHGQSGILTMEAIVKRPVVIDDAIAIRSMMNVCLTFDHRVIDGATVGAFLQGVKRRLEGYQPPF